MAIDLNMDVGDILDALRSSGGGDSFVVFAFATNAAVVLAALGAVFAWHQFYYMQQNTVISELHEEHEIYSQKSREMPQMQKNIVRMKSHLVDHKEQYGVTLNRFFDGTQIDTAYEHVSAIAKDTEMTVLAVKKGRAISDKDNLLIEDTALKYLELTPVPVSVRLKGSYPDYLRFRSAMEEGTPFYTVTSDSLTLTSDKRYFGYIEADITLTAYTMDKDAIITALAAY